MPTSSSLDQLVDVLTRLMDASKTLYDTLKVEHGHLSKQNVKALIECFPKKEEHLNHFENVQQELLTLLEIDETGQFATQLEKHTANLSHEERQKAMTLWRDVFHQLSECRNMNKMNGSIVQKNLQVTRRKIDILTNRSEEETYDKEGKV